MLAVKVDYETGRATIGTKKGDDVPKAEILKALDTLKYRGEFVND